MCGNWYSLLCTGCTVHRYYQFTAWELGGTRGASGRVMLHASDGRGGVRAARGVAVRAGAARAPPDVRCARCGRDGLALS